MQKSVPMWLLILKSSIRCLHWQIVLFLELPFKDKIDCAFCSIFSITAVSQNPPRTLGVTCLSPGRLSKTSHSLLHSNEITSDFISQVMSAPSAGTTWK